MPGPNEITPQQLNRLIGTPECPVIVDICTDEDFAADPRLIPTALRWDHGDPAGLARHIGTQRAVIACQKGKKLSQGLTSWLRSEGVMAENLSGGVAAWFELPGAQAVPAAAIPANAVWVTRHRPKIDRIACPWLIRRFVDRRARFLFVAPSEVQAVAERFDATPFDITGAKYSHRDDGCTFDAMLEAFGLRSAALDRLATIIRAADSNRHDLAPQAAGLLAVSVGLSRQYKDDHQQLEAGLWLYDALYRWARDGHEETHNWPMGHT
ncbi:Superoxide dismutase SodM-like protein [Candidatus Rhodobacter oscarellae]|uniref:Superoxide dismutase SodM-like protein n=1 Tax=Candidatus Rhodobacter oscarellae TaxID=1675527 RepID=A0A0J9E2S9_9RHOB|nr:sulfurtransferase/chromate resistance protein [Candidatus Rhodobacter lobularis]KMW57040.1 Superoxide dismutase SodM-like protein [Candidatus Rhodobacter lobularis]